MQRRPVTAVIFAGFFLLGTLFILWGIVLPDIATYLNMSEIISGALFSLFSLGMMIGAIVGGKYANRFDFVVQLAILFAVDAVAILVMTLFEHWTGVLAMAFIIGVISSAIITIGHTLIAQLYAEKRFSMMGFMDFMFSLGTFAADDRLLGYPGRGYLVMAGCIRLQPIAKTKVSRVSADHPG